MGRGFVANFLRQKCQCPGRGCLERENDHKYRTTGRDEPITSIVLVPLRARSSMDEDGAQQQNASPPAPFFSKNYSKFRAIFASLVLPCRPRLCPVCCDSHGREIAPLTHSRGRCLTFVVYDDGAECVRYSVREQHRGGQPVTCVTGCSTRAAALDSSLLAR